MKDKKILGEEEAKDIELHGDTANLLRENKPTYLQHPTLLFEVKKILDKDVVGEEKNKLTVFNLGLAPRLGSKYAQACYEVGPASSGKSYTIHQTLSAIEDFYNETTNPNGKIIWLTRASTHGLEYYCNKFQSMEGFILFVEEAPGYETAREGIRPMFSEKGLKIIVTVKGEGGKMEAKEYNVNGCPGFFTTNPNPITEPQMSSRIWILQTDETEEQTKKILDFIKKKGSQPENDLVNIEKQKLKEELKLLKKPDDMIIPFFEAIDFPTKQVRARRDLPKFETLMKVSAYLHQLQRPWIEHNGKDILVVTFADYYIAYQLITESLKALSYGVTENLLKLLEIVRAIKEDDKEEITSKKVTQYTNYSQTTVRAYLQNLVDAGLLVSEKVGRENHYDLLAEKGLDAILVDINELAKRFTEEKLKEKLQSLGLSREELTYNDLIGNIYDILTGKVLDANSVISHRISQQDTLSSNTITSDVVLADDSISPSDIRHNETLLEVNKDDATD